MENEQRVIEKIKRKPNSKEADWLISKYYDEIYIFSYKQTFDKELAMDLTQEIFISMLRSIASYDCKKASFRTWLYRIASNKIIDYRRSRSRKELLSIDDEAFELPYDEKTEEKFENSELIAKIEEYVSSFDAVRQEIFRLRVFAEYSFSQISEITDMPEASVKTSYYRMIKKIREEFADEYSDAD